MRTNITFSWILSILILMHFISCDKEGINSNQDSVDGGEAGIGGSMARFAINGDHLYTVDKYTLKAFNLENPKTPVYTTEKNLGFGIETIFPYENHLFIGTVTGMHVFNIDNPSNLVKVTTYSHVYSCDPVVVSGNYAYVTLHSEDSWCGRTTNELQVVDITDIQNINLAKTYSMTNPRGLGVDDGKLFLCDDGLKVYDASDPLNLKLLNYFKIKAEDVIPNDNLLMVTGDDGIYQYKYADDTISYLSTINVSTREKIY